MLKKKTPDLLTLLMTHAGDNSPPMPVIPRPPMLAPPLPSPFEAAKKKRKREALEEGELREGRNTTNLPTRTLQRAQTYKGSAKEEPLRGGRQRC